MQCTPGTEILGRWIEQAHKRLMYNYLTPFFDAIDVLRGVVNVSAERKISAIEFIKNNCRDTDEKTAVLAELEAKK